MLGSLPVPLEHVADLQHARVTIQVEPYQVILTEAILSDGTWRDVVDLARRVSPAPAVSRSADPPDSDARAFWAREDRWPATTRRVRRSIPLTAARARWVATKAPREFSEGSVEHFCLRIVEVALRKPNIQ
jgi:hypothetical protein